jgi:predicted nucleotidyltransferase
MKPPASLNVLDEHGGFDAITTKRGDTLWRPGQVLKKTKIGQLVSYNEKSFYQLNDDVTMAIYKVPGYRYPVGCWFDNKTKKRIA